MNEPKCHGGSLVWFVTPNFDLQIDEIFHSLVGEEADSIRKNKVPSPAAPFLALAEFRTESSNVTLTQHTGRLDLSIKPVEDPTSSAIPLVELSTVLSSLKNFLRSPNVLPDALRISCVIGCTYSADSSSDAVKNFVEFTGFDCGFDDPSDLMLQINRRKLFGGISSNRLVTANMVEMQSMQINTQNGLIMSNGPTAHALMITYDFNTVPDGSILDSELQRLVFKDIFEEIETAAATGNISFMKERA